MENIGEVRALFARNAMKSGFVTERAIASSTVYTRSADDGVVVAATVEQGSKVTLVHNIAVDSAYRRQGYGSTVLDEIVREAGSNTVEAKVRVGSASNEFFRANGWERRRQTCDGEMNVWHAP